MMDCEDKIFEHFEKLGEAVSKTITFLKENGIDAGFALAVFSDIISSFMALDILDEEDYRDFQRLNLKLYEMKKKSLLEIGIE